MLRLTSGFRTIPALAYQGRYVVHHSVPAFKAGFLPTRSSSSKDNKPLEIRKCFPGFVNKHGEKILFAPRSRPAGYKFTPSSNPYITRRCRELAKCRNETLFARYPSKRKTSPEMEQGLFVPKDILELVESEFEMMKVAVGKKWLRKLAEDYPNMPQIDRIEVCEGLYQLYLDSPKQFVWKRIPFSVRFHSLSKYTDFDSLRNKEDNEEALSEVYKKAKKIVSKWRGHGSISVKSDVSAPNTKRPIGKVDEL
ncbi:hypothetical protein F5Y01DRAFT_112580 [Xylaria sp. FL0043]|nr:hypothetical protein F5Y01DRAFT_112580 [Xylaria sp. FL0043]